jgi:hypothetical protein
MPPTEKETENRETNYNLTLETNSSTKPKKNSYNHQTKTREERSFPSRKWTPTQKKRTAKCLTRRTPNEDEDEEKPAPMSESKQK